MKLAKFPDPLDGERTLSVLPAPAPQVQAPWTRGRFTTGRTVTAPDLDQEQLQRSGRSALIGRALRHGTFRGLAASVANDAELRPRRVAVSAGHGLCASGEDVVLARALSADTAQLGITISTSLPVPNPAPGLAPTLANALTFWQSQGPAPDGRAREPALPSGAFDVAALARLPFPAVLIAQPVVIDELAAAGDPSDPCERDTEAEPFEDWRYTDGVRLHLMPVVNWLDERGLAPARWLNDALGGRRSLHAHRNGLASAMFDLRARGSQLPPWERAAVPLALLAFGPNGDVLWLDRAAVVRRAGRPSRVRPTKGLPDPELRRARIDQLSEQLSDTSAGVSGALAGALRRLPPVGILPGGLFDLRARTTLALPATWHITAAPIPVAQLDTALRGVSDLAPLDLDPPVEGDEVRLLVPVQDADWDPELLQTATPNEAFALTVVEAERRLTEAAQRRAELRAKIAAGYAAVGGAALVPHFPDDAPEAAGIEHAALGVLWDNPAALAFVAGLAGKEAPLLPDAASLLAAATALVHSGTGNAADAALAAVVRDAFVTAGSVGPVVVVPLDEARDERRALELIAGPAFDMRGGWAVPEMINRSADLAFERAVLLYIVAGPIDTEVIDRAVARGGQREGRVAVLGAEIDARAREDLAWAAQLQPDRVPLVCVLSGEALDARVKRLAALAEAVAAKEQQAGEFLSGDPVGVLAARDRVVVLAKGSKAGGAVLIVPNDEVIPGVSEPERATRVVQAVRALQTLAATKQTTALELLTHVGPALEASYGTLPNADGLAVEAWLTLSAQLSALKTASHDAAVISAAELTVLREKGIAGLIALLEEKVSRADDVVDFGFMQVQAATFRAREFMLGRDAAQRMAASPLLADLADALQSNTSPNQIQAFFEGLKAGNDTNGSGGGGGGGTIGDRWFKKALDISVSRNDVLRFDVLDIGPIVNPGVGPGTGPVVGPIVNPGTGPVINPGTGPVVVNPGTGPVINPGTGPVVVNPGTGPVVGPVVNPGTGPVVVNPGTGPIVVNPGIGPIVANPGTGPVIANPGVGPGVILRPGTPVVGPVRASRMAFSQPSAAASGGASTSGAAPRLAASRALPTGFSATSFTLSGNTPSLVAGTRLGGTGLAGTGQPFILATDDRLSTGLGGGGSGSGSGGSKAGPFLAGMLDTGALGTAVTANVSGLAQVAVAPKSPGATQLTAAAINMLATTPVSWSLRGSGVSQRVTDSKSLELRAEAFRVRGAVTQTLFALDLNLQGLPFPGFLDKKDAQLPVAVWLPLTAERVAAVLRGEHDSTTADADGPALISDAIRSLETTAAMLRVVAARIREVREAITMCHRAQAAIEALIVAAEARHDVLQSFLDEALHDLAVSQALLQEEEQRVLTTNTRRASVLAKGVAFLVYHRAREIDVHGVAPKHDLEPALSVNPTLAALQQPAPSAPDELRDAIDLWREAPARWLTHVNLLLPTIDRFDVLHGVLIASQARATLQLQQSAQVFAPLLAGVQGRNLVSGLVQTRRATLAVQRQPASQLVTSALSQLSWKQAQGAARDLVSSGDLIATPATPPALAARVNAELESIYKVAANLYRELSLVAPGIRVRWAQLVSEYDRPIDLHDVSSLPGWADVGFGDAGTPADPFQKRELTSYVAWLFDRIDAREPEAVALMNDLIRVCILLASHAPVGRILAGHVAQPTPVEPGRLVPVHIDPRTVRVGMAALWSSQGKLQARGVIEDLADGRAMMRVLSTSVTGAVLTTNDTIRFVESEVTAVERAPVRTAVPATTASKLRALR